MRRVRKLVTFPFKDLNARTAKIKKAYGRREGASSSHIRKHDDETTAATNDETSPGWWIEECKREKLAF